MCEILNFRLVARENSTDLVSLANEKSRGRDKRKRDFVDLLTWILQIHFYLKRKRIAQSVVWTKFSLRHKILSNFGANLHEQGQNTGHNLQTTIDFVILPR